MLRHSITKLLVVFITMEINVVPLDDVSIRKHVKSVRIYNWIPMNATAELILFRYVVIHVDKNSVGYDSNDLTVPEWLNYVQGTQNNQIVAWNMTHKEAIRPLQVINRLTAVRLININHLRAICEYIHISKYCQVVQYLTLNNCSSVVNHVNLKFFHKINFT